MTTLALRSAWPKIKDNLLNIAAYAAPFVLIYLGREIQEHDQTIGLLDAGIWQLVVLSTLCFMGLSSLSWWLLQKAWVSLGLPKIEMMVSHFKTLTICQQFAFYWASFALLLLAAVLSLVAVF
ncbi:MAG: hypothetical protein V4663_16675 [Bacteroidota bacterium]